MCALDIQCDTAPQFVTHTNLHATPPAHPPYQVHPSDNLNEPACAVQVRAALPQTEADRKAETEHEICNLLEQGFAITKHCDTE